MSINENILVRVSKAGIRKNAKWLVKDVSLEVLLWLARDIEWWGYYTMDEFKKGELLDEPSLEQIISADEKARFTSLNFIKNISWHF